MTFKDYKKELTGIKIQQNKQQFVNESKAFCVAVTRKIQREIDLHFSLFGLLCGRSNIKSFLIQ